MSEAIEICGVPVTSPEKVLFPARGSPSSTLPATTPPWREGALRGSGGRPNVLVRFGHLAPEDILVDAMRGRYSTWTRIRINLQHVPETLRPPQEPLDPDEKMSWS